MPFPNEGPWPTCEYCELPQDNTPTCCCYCSVHTDLPPNDCGCGADVVTTQEIGATRDRDMHLTVNVEGNVVAEAKAYGFHAYYASNVTAVEITSKTKIGARDQADALGWNVLYVFE